MRRFTYLLTFLLLSAQVDDALVAAPLPDANDECLDANDEYLPAQQRQREDEPASDQGPRFIGLKSHSADIASLWRGVSPEWNLAPPFTSPPLYVFMSLQI
jgi:hypothetical protein